MTPFVSFDSVKTKNLLVPVSNHDCNFSRCNCMTIHPTANYCLLAFVTRRCHMCEVTPFTSIKLTQTNFEL